jgi:hypothetical protein
VIDVGLEELLKERSSFGYVGVLARETGICQQAIQPKVGNIKGRLLFVPIFKALQKMK